MPTVVIDASRPTRPTARGTYPLGAESAGPALRRQLDALGDRPTTVVLGRHADAVLPHVPEPVTVLLNRDWDDAGEAHSFAMAMRRTPPDCGAWLIPFGVPFPALPTTSDSAVVTTEEPGDSPGVQVLDGRVSRLDFGLPGYWTGVTYLSPAAKVAYLRATEHPTRRRWFLFEILNLLIDGGAVFRAVAAP